MLLLMIRKNWAHSNNFRDLVELVAADCGAKEYSCIYLLHQKMQNTFPHYMPRSTL